jgi:hypothetical protein
MGHRPCHKLVTVTQILGELKPDCAEKSCGKKDQADPTDNDSLQLGLKSIYDNRL